MQFPGLAGGWHYLDTAATAQKPQAVIDATVKAMGADYATVHRGVYARSANMTLAFEAARRRVARFIGGQGGRNGLHPRRDRGDQSGRAVLTRNKGRVLLSVAGASFATSCRGSSPAGRSMSAR